MQPPLDKRTYETIVDDLVRRLKNGGVLTDVNPGSVVRTLAEAFALEMAEAYARLQKIYEWGYIDTAEGEALDHLVAILGQQRIEGMQAIGEAVFERDPRVRGRIVIPKDTELLIETKRRKALTYRTSQNAELQAGQSVVTVPIACDVPPGEPVESVLLSKDDLEQTTQISSLAGIASVVIPRSTNPRGYQETDADLRKRVKGLINAAGGGTYKAIERAILATGKVSSVVFRDSNSAGFPVLHPGELEVAVDVTDGDLSNTETYEAVRSAIDASKGPGIWVKVRGISETPMSFSLKLKLVSSNISPEKRETIRRAVQDAVADAAGTLAIGKKLLWNPMLAKMLNIDGVLDIAEGSEVRLLENNVSTPYPARGEIPNRDMKELERLVLDRTGPPVAVAFEGESTLLVRLIVEFAAGVTVSDRPKESVRSAVSRAIENWLREKNAAGGNRELSWKEAADVAQGVPDGNKIPRAGIKLEIKGSFTGGEVTLKDGQVFKLGPDDVLQPDPQGPSWRDPT
ncbi:hypothetical protein E5161_07165 [Cohnella pontilimi]|uniref:Uncharacterized protein n=1 Tax=Cohnella pontilimi TaxID=2564100 RepID=A0A4U0FCU9_9BACL|nr:baseplate J/gp47 family protein [Cohnella pontilimi]TJY42625.1 hypothetical protein E5161_07165 [Cohnella pontilimi]